MIQTQKMLKALSDTNRLRVVMALARQEELCACQITELLQVTGASVSRHLGMLQQAGILESRREGRWMYYRLAPPSDAAELFQWLEQSCGSAELFEADRLELKRIVDIGRETLCRMQRGEACCPPE
jgi:ArsR family transcriptional regulator